MSPERHIQTDGYQPSNYQFGDPQIGERWARLSGTAGRPEYHGLFDRKRERFLYSEDPPII